MHDGHISPKRAAATSLRGTLLVPYEGRDLTPRRDAARSLRGLRLDSLWHISNVGHISGIIPLSPLFDPIDLATLPPKYQTT